MSIFTELTEQQITAFIQPYAVGDLTYCSPINGGTQNSNYHVQTTQGEFLLTIFEKGDAAALLPILKLLQFLRQEDFPCNSVQIDEEGHPLQMLQNKPAVLLHYLPGEPVLELNDKQLITLGEHIGKLHTLTESLPFSRPHGRDAAWCLRVAKKVLPQLPSMSAKLLESELIQQTTWDFSNLSKGVIHADLFRDNILFQDNELTGIIDFYDAAYEYQLFDVAVACLDCCYLSKHSSVDERIEKILLGYQCYRPFTADEKACWIPMLRIAVLTFWLLRLHNQYFPAPGQVVFKKNPAELEVILKRLRV